MGMILGTEGYGQTSITKFMLGTEQVDKIYKGSILVWPVDAASTDTGTVDATWTVGLDALTGKDVISFPPDTPRNALGYAGNPYKSTIAVHVSGDGNRVGVVTRKINTRSQSGSHTTSIVECYLCIFEKNSLSRWEYKASVSLGVFDSADPYGGQIGSGGHFAGSIYYNRTTIDCDETGSIWVARITGAYSYHRNGIGVYEYSQDNISNVDFLQVNFHDITDGSNDRAGTGPGNILIGMQPCVTSDGTKIGATILQSDNTVAYKVWTNATSTGAWQTYNSVIPQGDFYESTRSGYSPSWQHGLLTKDGSEVFGVLAFTSVSSADTSVYAKIGRWRDETAGWEKPATSQTAGGFEVFLGYLDTSVSITSRPHRMYNEFFRFSASDDGTHLYFSRANYYDKDDAHMSEPPIGKAWLYELVGNSYIERSNTFPDGHISPDDLSFGLRSNAGQLFRYRNLNEQLANGISSDGTRVIVGHAVPRNNEGVFSSMYVFTSSNGQFNPLGNPIKFPNARSTDFRSYPFSLSRDGQTVVTATHPQHTARVEGTLGDTYSDAFQVYTTTD